jgi:hypothetical protein
MRLFIVIAFIAAYLAWVALYLMPYSREQMFSDANLRRVFHAAIHY